MPLTVNEAIEKALLDKAIAFAAAQSPALQISLQNGIGADGKHFSPPKPEKNKSWLRATVLHAHALTTGIPYTSHVHHHGLLQVDVMRGIGGGALPMVKIVGAIRQYFPMGLVMPLEDFLIRVSPLPGSRRVVSQGPLMNDSESWAKIPVSIPWICFEQPA